MIRLNYITDSHFLASYIIANYHQDCFLPADKEPFIQYKKDIIAFQNLAWKQSEVFVNLIDGRVKIYKYSAKNKHSYEQMGKDLDNFIATIIQSAEFKVIEKHVEQSKQLIVHEWESNYKKTSEYLKSLGIDFEATFDIFLAPTIYKEGHNTRNNQIFWSYQTHWPNYNTIYLWHEVLHSYFDGDSTDQTHAL